MDGATTKRRRPATRREALLRSVDIAVPVCLALLIAYMVWPALGLAGLAAGVVATLVSTALAGMFQTRESMEDTMPVLGSVPIEGFERTHRPGELSEAQSGTRDGLTGLPDHVALFAAGAPLLVSETPRLLALLELSELSEFNLRMGRKAGDEVLRSVARILQSEVGRNEVVARCRGAQFALLLEGDSVGASFRRLKSIQARLAEHPIIAEGIRVRSRTGLAWYPRHGLNMATLLNRAGTALETACAADRECAIYSPATDTGLNLEQELTADLALAIENGEIDLAYQPLLPLDGSDPCGFEALARWEHPEWGNISPETFVGLAEQGGLINRLTRRVLHQAVQQLAAWRHGGIEARLSINLSAHDLFDDTLPSHIARLCDSAMIDPGLLSLEVTETAMISDLARARLTLKRLRKLGLRVIIDDFGTGFSSLDHLRQLPVDGIKIDKTFVRDLRRGSNESAIVRVSIELAHSLGLWVTAEGVENEYVQSRLIEFQADSLQGFHVCPPLPADAVPGWLVGNELRAGRGRQHRLPLIEYGAGPAA